MPSVSAKVLSLMIVSGWDMMCFEVADHPLRDVSPILHRIVFILHAIWIQVITNVFGEGSAKPITPSDAFTAPVSMIVSSYEPVVEHTGLLVDITGASLFKWCLIKDLCHAWLRVGIKGKRAVASTLFHITKLTQQYLKQIV